MNLTPKYDRLRKSVGSAGEYRNTYTADSETVYKFRNPKIQLIVTRLRPEDIDMAALRVPISSCLTNDAILGALGCVGQTERCAWRFSHAVTLSVHQPRFVAQLLRHSADMVISHPCGKSFHSITAFYTYN